MGLEGAVDMCHGSHHAAFLCFLKLLSPPLMQLCDAAGHSTSWWKLPGSGAVLEYALAVQQRIRSSWEAAASQPPHQPWHALAALLCAGQAMPEAHRVLLLRVVLELPPPTQVQCSSWKHDTTSHPSLIQLSGLQQGAWKFDHCTAARPGCEHLLNTPNALPSASAHG